VPDFQRLFPFIGRMFPPYGNAGLVTPNSVSSDVSLVHELFKPDMKHNIQLVIQQLTLTAAAGTNTLDTVEPPEGFVDIVLTLAVAHDDAAARSVNFRMLQTGNSPDLITGWPAGVIWTQVVAPNGNELMVVGCPPVPRSNTIRTTWFSITVGTALLLNLYAIRMPVQLVNWQQVMISSVNYLRNRAI